MLSDLRQKRINPIDVMKRLCTIFWFLKKRQLSHFSRLNKQAHAIKNSYFYNMIILCTI